MDSEFAALFENVQKDILKSVVCSKFPPEWLHRFNELFELDKIEPQYFIVNELGRAKSSEHLLIDK